MKSSILATFFAALVSAAYVNVILRLGCSQKLILSSSALDCTTTVNVFGHHAINLGPTETEYTKTVTETTTVQCNGCHLATHAFNFGPGPVRYVNFPRNPASKLWHNTWYFFTNKSPVGSIDFPHNHSFCRDNWERFCMCEGYSTALPSLIIKCLHVKQNAFCYKNLVAKEPLPFASIEGIFTIGKWTRRAANSNQGTIVKSKCSDRSNRLWSPRNFALWTSETLISTQPLLIILRLSSKLWQKPWWIYYQSVTVRAAFFWWIIFLVPNTFRFIYSHPLTCSGRALNDLTSVGLNRTSRWPG